MRVASILDIPTIIEILRDYLSPEELSGMEFNISMKMKVPGVIYFISDSEDTFMLAEQLGSNSKAQIHIYSKSSSEKKHTIDFIKECIQELLLSTEYQSFIGFTPIDNRPAGIIASAIGLKQVGEIQFDSGVKERITMITRKELEGKQWV